VARNWWSHQCDACVTLSHSKLCQVTFSFPYFAVPAFSSLAFSTHGATFSSLAFSVLAFSALPYRLVLCRRKSGTIFQRSALPQKYVGLFLDESYYVPDFRRHCAIRCHLAKKTRTNCTMLRDYSTPKKTLELVIHSQVSGVLLVASLKLKSEEKTVTRPSTVNGYTTLIVLGRSKPPDK